MEFEVKVGLEGTPFRFSQFDDVLEFIKTYMAQWNNFNPELRFEVFVKKVESDTPTIGVNSGEKIDVEDVFGRR